MVRIGPMASPKTLLDRRALMTGLGASVLVPQWPDASLAQGRPTLVLNARPATLALRAGGPSTPIWSLQGPELRFRRGDSPEITFGNELPVPAVLNWQGIDGAAAAEPLTARTPLAPGRTEAHQLPLRHAGTFVCGLGLLGDGQAQPPQARPLIVRKPKRSRPTVTTCCSSRTGGCGRTEPQLRRRSTPRTLRQSIQLTAGLRSISQPRIHERVRLRIINGCQRSVIAVKLEGFEVRVMAIDGQPAEPFQARNGAVVVAPGGRVDVFVDVTAPAGSSNPILLHDGKEARPIGKIIVSNEPPMRNVPLPPAPPLPSNGLPERIELRGAPGSIWRSAAPGRLGDTGQLHCGRPARLPRQGWT
ncbi:copper oxidase [Bradyrhizobium sp. TZ2]